MRLAGWIALILLIGLALNFVNIALLVASVLIGAVCGIFVWEGGWKLWDLFKEILD